MRRREFIALFGNMTAVWPLAARAQQPAMPMIGFLHSLSREAVRGHLAAFMDGLKDGGYEQGRNVEIEFRWAEGRYDHLPQLARELVEERVVILVAGSTVAAIAAKAATSTIPVVFTGVGDDPVQLGLVSSLNHSGNNVTGVSILTIMLAGKRLELLRAVVPAAKIIAVLVNPNNPNSDAVLRELPKAAAMLGLMLVPMKATTSADIETCFSNIVQQHADALFVDSDPFFLANRVRLVTLAAQHGVPAIYEFREFSVAGGLMTYTPDINDAYHQAGIYTARILKGEKPGDLPVTQPTKFELVINLKTAKALGLTIPDKLLALADEVIE